LPCESTRGCRRHCRTHEGGQPDVVVTFGPDGAYGHPDHVAISQFTTAAIVAAADPAFSYDEIEAVQSHAASKPYYMAWPESTWKAYQSAFRKLVSTVDGIERQAVGDYHSD